MKLEDLVRLQRCFHEATHAACSGLEGLSRWPVAKLSLWSDFQLQAGSDLAARLAVVSDEVGDKALGDECRALVVKAGAAIKHALEAKAVNRAEKLAAKRGGGLLEPQGDPG